MKRPLHMLGMGIASAAWLAIVAMPASATDCNSNGISDSQDIAGGSSLDCNHDLIPDECDLLAVNYGLEVVKEVLPRPTGGTSWVTALDLEGDADLDLAASINLSSAVALYQNVGALQFVPPTAIPSVVGVGMEPMEIVAGDFDGDGSSDLATSNYQSNDITVLLNDRHGVFSTASYPVVRFARTLALADLDADGDLDLAVAGAIEPNQVDVLFNRGRGTFDPPERTSVFSEGGFYHPSVAAGDVDGDQKPDLLVSPGNQKLTVLRNSGDRTFTEELASSLSGVSASAIDFDGDGDRDLVTDAIAVYLNPGNGRFTQPAFARPLDEGLVNRPAVADLDGDGDQDVLVRLRALLNHGGGQFSISPRLAVEGGPLVADLDGDGRLEVLDQMDLRIYRSRPIAYSADCNGNHIPDECDLEMISQDCNLNLIPDECDLAEGLSQDCNRNGILDICETDCNRNGIEDSCDLAAGIGEDLDHDGLIDHCDPVFTLGFEAPAAVQGLPGEIRRFDLFLTLAVTNNVTAYGAQAWSLSLFSEGGTVREISLQGIEVNTIYDDSQGGHHDPYFFDLANSFTRIASLAEHYQDPSRKGAISAVVMSGLERVVLQPRLTQRIARLSVEATVPAGGGCAPLTIYYENGGKTSCSCSTNNVITHQGRSLTPILGSTTILLCPAPFRRGDVNSDNLVDISDAIFTLSHLFLAGDPLSCEEAGNVNNDQFLDLSDPVYLLESLFLGGGLGRIAAPGAYQCGSGAPFQGFSCDSSPCPLELPGEH